MTQKRITYLKQALTQYSQRLDQKGFVANHDGNLTVKIDSGYLATPTSVPKAFITPEQIITLDFQGKKTAGVGKPFGELNLHLAAYQARPDAQAVIHAHPPFATAFGLTGQPIKPRLPEAIVSLGGLIPLAPYSMPGSPQNAVAVHEALMIGDVFLIAGNGVLAIGDDLEQAYLRLELVEHLAKIEFYASHLGATMDLPAEDRQALLDKRKTLGLGPQAQLGDIPRPVARPEQKTKDALTDDIKDIIAEEIAKALKQ